MSLLIFNGYTHTMETTMETKMMIIAALKLSYVNREDMRKEIGKATSTEKRIKWQWEWG